jgi:hypothetical protein
MTGLFHVAPLRTRRSLKNISLREWIYQYSETNVMHFLFSLLRIKGLYVLRALLAHPQEVLHVRHLVNCVRVMLVGCLRHQFHSSPGSSQLTKH